MKYKARQIAAGDDGPNMTPMLDIVFILLIFFIVTAVFLDEKAINLASLPDNNPPCDCGETIQVYVDADNKVAVENKPTELRNVSFAVESLLAEKPNASIVLSAHYNAHLDPIVRVKDQMTLSGRKAVLKIVKD